MFTLFFQGPPGFRGQEGPTGPTGPTGDMVSADSHLTEVETKETDEFYTLVSS